jgi:hypothetical protein
MQVLACIHAWASSNGEEDAMRIDLEHGGRRPWYLKLGLIVAKLVIGAKPPPMMTMTYRPDLFPRALRGYILRGVSHDLGAWTKGEAELMAAFVSDLNTCHF